MKWPPLKWSGREAGRADGHGRGRKWRERRDGGIADVKAQVPVGALKGEKTMAELTQIYGIHPATVTQ